MLLPEQGRLRVSTDMTVSDTDLTFTAGGGVHFTDTNLFWTLWSSLYDFPRRGHRDRVSHVLPVEHVHIKALQPLVIVTWTGGVGYVVPNSRGSGGLYAADPIYLQTVLIPPVSESLWVETSIDAFNALTDQFPADLSLGNFLLELGDLADTVKKVWGAIVKLKNAGVFNRNLTTRYRAGAVRTTIEKAGPLSSKAISGAFLDYSFNWAPLVKDLNAIFGLCQSITSRIDFLKSTRGKPTKVGFAKDLAADWPVTTFIHDDPGYGGFTTEISVENYKCKYLAGAWLLQDLKHLDDFYGLLRAFMGKTGLNNPFKVAWNAIPFSFVLDWFVHVSSYLGRFTIQGADGQWILRDLTCSIKQSALIKVVEQDRVTSQRTLIGVYDFVRYTRLTELPVTLRGLPPLHTLNPKQLALLLAMSA